MNTFIIIGIALNCIILAVSITFTKQWKPVNIYYALLLFLRIITMPLVTLLIETKLLLDFPHFYRVSVLLEYVFLGVFILFNQQAFGKNKSQSIDWLFFVPAIIYLFDFGDFFLLSAELKRQIIAYDIVHHEVYLFKQAKFLPAKAHLYLYSMYLVITAVYQATLMIRLLRRNDKIFYYENKQVIHFNLFNAFVVVITVLPLVQPFVNIPPELTEKMIFLTISIINISIPISLLFSPKILYGFSLFNSNETVTNQSVSVDIPVKLDTVSQKPKITTEQAGLMLAEIETYMNISKPYLNANFNFNELAYFTNFQARHISNLFNAYLNTNFNNYVNKFRINEFIERFQNDPAARSITFEALANECGFNSRFTFILAFKKHTGGLPSQYFAELSFI